MKYGYILLLYSIIFLGCTNSNMPEKNNKQVLSDSTKVSDRKIWSNIAPGTDIPMLKKLVMEKGDTLAYNKLGTIYLASKELLPYSEIMADKYDYRYASYMVYLHLIMEEYPKKNDKKTLDKALKYLFKAAQKDEFNACRDIGFHYIEGKYLQQDTVLGKAYLSRIGIDADEYMRTYYP